MAPVGQACLFLALATCGYGIGASLYGALTGRRDWVDSGRRSVYGLAVLTTAAFAVLEIAFLRSDFHFVTVAQHSSTTTPTFYKADACLSTKLLFEFDDTSCHEEKVHKANYDCSLPDVCPTGGKCITVQNACGAGNHSARCQCNP